MGNIDYVNLAVTVVFAYLLGSFSTSLMVSKIANGIDIRDHGSGNAGMTNVLRILGKKAAFWVTAGDMIKTVAAVIIGRMLLGDAGGWIGGVCCVIGHIFPAYYQFKGGKGVLTAATAILCMDFRIFALVISVFIIAVAASKMVSLGSILAAVTIFPSLLLFNHPAYANAVLIIMALLVIYKHIPNIKRIIKGVEPKLAEKKGGGVK